MNNIKAIVFDLGGVVVDFNPKELIENFTNNKNEQVLFMELMKHNDWLEMDRGVLSTLDVANRFFERSLIPVERTMAFFQSIRHNFSEIKETKEWIQSLKHRGYKIYALSNINIDTLNFLRNKFEVFQYFDDGIYSEDVKTVKPEKEIFDKFIKNFNLKTNEFVFLDDTIINVQTSRNLGWNSYQYNKFNLVDVQSDIERLFNL